MRIAHLQTEGHLEPTGGGDPEANLGALASAAARARANGATLLTTPELYLTGSHIGREAAHALATPRDGPWLDRVAALARTHSLAILCGYAERDHGACYNAVTLIDQRGAHVGHYRKTHLYGEDDHGVYGPGEALTVVELDGVRVGLLICYDIELPETARVLALRGAEVILVATALKASWAGLASRLIPTRALENQVFVLYGNRTGEENGLRYCGLSCVAAPDGSVIAEAGPGEELLLADLDLDGYASARRLTPYLVDRRPTLYAELCQPRTDEPRTDEP